MKKLEDTYEKMRKFIEKKEPNDIDLKEVQNVKAFIRKSEALAGARYAGLEDENIHFMALPFYETGKRVKNPVTEKDVKLTMELLQKIKPQQIFAAGDFADPHGTHVVCFRIILEAHGKASQNRRMDQGLLALDVPRRLVGI